VFDRFHVQKLVGDALERIRRAVWHTDMEVDRRKLIKGTRWLLLRNGPDLYDSERERLDNVLQMNEPLYKAYVLKEYFREVWTQGTKAEAEKVQDDWIEQAMQSKVPQLGKLAASIAGFKSGILAYYDCRMSNARVEGINNKIKVLKRTAYGYRDDEYFKLRLFNLHNDKITRFVG
jgi:transposase